MDRPRAMTLACVAAWIGLLSSPCMAQLVCSDPMNLTTNCGFDADYASWVIDAGTPTWISGDGNDQAGCLELVSVTTMNEEVRISQCVSGVAASTSYGMGGFVKAMGAAPPDNCFVQATRFSDGACGTSLLGMSDASISSFPAGWNKIYGTFVSEAGTGSVMIEVLCGSATPFTVRIDDVFLGEGLTPVELQEFTAE